MDMLLTLLFSFYASLDALVLTQHHAHSLRLPQCIHLSLISSFFSLVGTNAGYLALPYFQLYQPEDLVTIALMFVLLYLFGFHTEKYALIQSLLCDQQIHLSRTTIGVLFSMNNLGFGFLAGLKLLPLFWMMLFSFLFSCLFLYKKPNNLPYGKAISILLLILMILLIQKKK